MDALVNNNSNSEINIDVNGLLMEYGISPALETSTVIQSENTIINIPHDMLNPPSLDTNENIEDVQVASVVTEDEIVSSIVTANSNITSATEVSQPPEEHIDASESNSLLASDNSEILFDDANMFKENPKDLEFDESTSRFSGAVWFNAIQQSVVTVAGLGGIGSYTLFCLSRMKPSNIFLYDDDIVEFGNLSGQLYSASMVGTHKVDAMAKLAIDFSDYFGVIAIPERLTPHTEVSDILICGFDNMPSRRIAFAMWKAHVVKSEHPEKCLFIDGRLSFEEFQVFCIQGNDRYNIKRYEKEFLFSDYEAESEICSMKQTTYCSNMIGSVIVNLFTNFIANSISPNIYRSLPFKTYYNAAIMHLITEL